MSDCFDTSVLVAALLEQHPHHTASSRRLLDVHSGVTQGSLTTHALAELFSVLTAMPLKPRLQPAAVSQMIEHNIVGKFKIIPLTAKLYLSAITLTARQGGFSGAVYDALHVVGARAAGCTRLFTLNLKHFSQLSSSDPMVMLP